MRRLAVLLLATAAVGGVQQGAYASAPTPEQQLAALVERFAPEDPCAALSCPTPVARDFSPRLRAVLSVYRRAAPAVHAVARQQITAEPVGPSPLLDLAFLAGELDPPLLRILARRAWSAPSSRSDSGADLAEFLAERLAPAPWEHARSPGSVSEGPPPDDWAAKILGPKPANAAELSRQRSFAEIVLGHMSLEGVALPWDVVEPLVDRYPDLFARYGIAHHVPRLLGALVGRLVADHARTELIPALARQLSAAAEAGGDYAKPVERLPVGLRLCVFVHAMALDVPNGLTFEQAFLEELGRNGPEDVAAQLRRSPSRGPYVPALHIALLDPDQPAIAAGMRRVLSNPLPVRIQEPLPEEGAAAAKWARWVLEEWKAGRIPHGRPSTNRHAKAPSETDLTNPFELLLLLGVDAVAEFATLSVPELDHQQARLIDAFCQAPGAQAHAKEAFAALERFGPEARYSVTWCASLHKDSPAWSDAVVDAMLRLGSALDGSALEAVISGPWTPQTRDRLADTVARVEPRGPVLAALIRYAGAETEQQGERRVEAMRAALEALARMPSRALAHRDTESYFAWAVDTVRTALHRTLSEQAAAALTTREIDAVHATLVVAPEVRPYVDAAEQRARAGVVRWAFSI